MDKRVSFVTDVIARRAKYRLTTDASVSVGIRRCFKREGKRKGESVKEKKGGRGREREIEQETLIGVARWPCGRPAKSSFCYDPEIRSRETTCVSVTVHRVTTFPPTRLESDRRFVERLAIRPVRPRSKVEVVFPVSRERGTMARSR